MDEHDDGRRAAGGESALRLARELTDEELVEIWEATTSGVRDGRIEMFDDKQDLVRSVMSRLGR